MEPIPPLLRKHSHVFVTVAAALALTLMGRAQTQLDTCSGAGNPTTGQIIAACNAYLQTTHRMYYPRARVLRNAAVAYAGQGDNADSSAYLTRALRLTPTDSNLYFLRGEVDLRQGQTDAAIADETRSIQLFSDEAPPYLVRGWAEQQKKEYDQAIADFTLAIQHYAQLADAYNSRCWTRDLANIDLPLALADCNRAVQLDPKNADDLDSRGFTHLRLGQWSNAIADYTAALALNPKLASSLYGRGLARRNSGDAQGAASDLAAAQALDPGIVTEFAGYGVH